MRGHLVADTGRTRRPRHRPRRSVRIPRSSEATSSPSAPASC